jgi:hypothetical protein
MKKLNILNINLTKLSNVIFLFLISTYLFLGLIITFLIFSNQNNLFNQTKTLFLIILIKFLIKLLVFFNSNIFIRQKLFQKLIKNLSKRLVSIQSSKYFLIFINFYSDNKILELIKYFKASLPISLGCGIPQGGMGIINLNFNKNILEISIILLNLINYLYLISIIFSILTIIILYITFIFNSLPNLLRLISSLTFLNSSLLEIDILSNFILNKLSILNNLTLSKLSIINNYFSLSISISLSLNLIKALLYSHSYIPDYYSDIVIFEDFTTLNKSSINFNSFSTKPLGLDNNSDIISQNYNLYSLPSDRALILSRNKSDSFLNNFQSSEIYDYGIEYYPGEIHFNRFIRAHLSDDGGRSYAMQILNEINYLNSKLSNFTQNSIQSPAIQIPEYNDVLREINKLKNCLSEFHKIRMNVILEKEEYISSKKEIMSDWNAGIEFENEFNRLWKD